MGRKKSRHGWSQEGQEKEEEEEEEEERGGRAGTHTTRSQADQDVDEVAAGCDYGGDVTQLCTQAAQRRRRPGFAAELGTRGGSWTKCHDRDSVSPRKTLPRGFNYPSLLPDASVCRGRLGPRNGGAKNLSLIHI